MKAIRLQADPIPSNQKDTSSNRASDASRKWRNPRVSLENVPVPTLRPGELLVKVAFCGLCGSDYHLADSRPEGSIFYPGLVELPVTIGHEFSGQVVGHASEMSDAAKSSFPIGSLVTAEEMLWCGECGSCRAGHLNHCENIEELGFTRDGAHAEYVRVHSKYCWRLDELVPRFGEIGALRLGALVEPYSVSFRALFQGAHGGKWLPGDSVLILGAGPIGIAALDLAHAAGASEIHVVEPIESRREFAARLGASRTLKPEGMRGLTGKYDWIIDTAGTADAVELSGSLLKVGGSLCLLARTNAPGTIAPESLITNNSRIFGSQGHSGQSAFPRVITLMASGRLRADELVSSEISLEEAVDRLSKQQKQHGKVLVRPTGA